ncbi:beta,beta-carotene 15,15'-dioxygenase-like [Ptychodera flava]|uniref:beta,beta-carotene 15,15'-dioxygenase-like n=1 Tax=Ptychodera flava TaxID=63121 RepID=UPI003969DD53
MYTNAKLILLLGVFATVTSWEVPENINDTFFGSIGREHPYGEAEVQGDIPEWISGYFIHQTVGSLGNHDNTEEGGKLTHTFDGLGTVASFKFNSGHAEFSTRFYVTQPYKIFDYYSRDMDKSKVAWGTIFSPMHQQQLSKWSGFNDYVNDNPNVAFWKIGDNVQAMSEALAGIWFTLDTLESKGLYPFKDTNLGLPSYMVSLNNPAHEQTDEDGVTVYGSTVMYDVSDITSVNATRFLYKIVDDERIPIASFHEAGPFDLNQCHLNDSYPALNTRGGYMHSFSMTQNYFVMPISAYLINVCSIFVSNPLDPEMPFFLGNWQFSDTKPTRFVIISRSTNQVVGEFSTPDGLFITHQLSSYELDGKMYLDMLTYQGNIYWHFYIDELMAGPRGMRTRVERFVVDMSDWSLEERVELFPSRDHELLEFSTVNYQYHNAKPYKYAYMVGFDPLPNVLIKLNVDTGESVYWGPYDGLLPGEPIFVATPGSTSEDDGVVIANVLDSNAEKGMVVVLDAATFTELGRVISPEVMPFGLHSKFIHQDFEPIPKPTTVSAASQPVIRSVYILLVSSLVLLSL